MKQKEKPAKTSDFDTKVEEVCDCFKKAKAEGKSPSACYMMQGKYANLQGDKKQEFTQKTNSCN